MIAKRLYDDASGWIAAVFYAIFSVGFYPKMQAANTEMFAVLPSTLAGFAYIEARRVNRTYYLFLAGLFAGLAILFKQTAALLPFALAMGSVVNTWRKERRFLPGIEASALLGLGVLVALIPMALYLHVWGVLEDAVFWTWTYIFHHYFPSVHDSYLQRLLGIPVLLIGAMAPVIALAWFARHHNVWPLGWWLVSMFLSGFAG
jgi:4-amino-4-deoxy-L-arabinose transferase-like glycosyltransferase